MPERFAKRMQNQIIESDVLETYKPPPEPELMQSFGVGKTVVKEAVEILMGRGLVDVRPLRSTIVKALDGSGVAESLAAQVHMNRVSLEQSLEVRLMLESSVARSAAQNRTENDLRLLYLNVAEMSESRDRDHTIELDVAFHEALAAATHNSFFLIVAKLINDPLRLFIMTSWAMCRFARQQYQSMERLLKQCVKEILKKQKKRLANIYCGLPKASKIYLPKSLRVLMIKITLFLNFEILVVKGLSGVKKSK